MKLDGQEPPFLTGTRGRILNLVRKTGATVSDLAGALGLTGNAVRSHLAALEREGLVRSVGTRRGVRKPHQTYGLTSEGQRLFPSGYRPVLRMLLPVLKERVPAHEVEDAVREAGRRLAVEHRDAVAGEPFDVRVRRAVEALEEMGALVECEAAAGGVIIRGANCPLADVEGCPAVQAFIAEIVGEPVQGCCEREDAPRCGFAIERPA